MNKCGETIPNCKTGDAPTCQYDVQHSQYTCTECKQGWKGEQCDECAEGYKGDNCNECEEDKEYHLIDSACKKCGENEEWDTTNKICKCQQGYQQNEEEKCVLKQITCGLACFFTIVSNKLTIGIDETKKAELKNLKGEQSGNMIDFEEGDQPWYEYRNEIQSIEILGGLRSIGRNAFKGFTKVSEVQMGEYIESIGKESFSGCTSLHKITIPQSVMKIEENAFDGCTELEEIYYESDIVLDCDESTFNGCPVTTMVVEAGYEEEEFCGIPITEKKGEESKSQLLQVFTLGVLLLLFFM